MYDVLVLETCPQNLLHMQIHYMIGSFPCYLFIALLFQTWFGQFMSTFYAYLVRQLTDSGTER